MKDKFHCLLINDSALKSFQHELYLPHEPQAGDRIMFWIYENKEKHKHIFAVTNRVISENNTCITVVGKLLT